MPSAPQGTDMPIYDLRTALLDLVSSSAPPAAPGAPPTHARSTRQLLDQLRSNIGTLTSATTGTAADPMRPSSAPEEQGLAHSATPSGESKNVDVLDDPSVETCLSGIRALDFRARDKAYENCKKEVQTLQDRLYMREREVVALATIVDHLRVSLDAGKRAAYEASILKKIVQALAEATENDGEAAAVRRELQELDARRKASELDLNERLQRKDAEIASLKRALHRQVQVSSEKEGAIEATCTILKSTNHFLSEALLEANANLGKRELARKS